MNYIFTKAVIISLLVHAVFFSFLIYYNRQGNEPFGQEFVSVEIIGDGAGFSSPPLSKGGEGGFKNSDARGTPPRAPAIQGGDRAPPLQTSYDTPRNDTQGSSNGNNESNEPNGLNEASTLTPTLSPATITSAGGHEGRGGFGSLTGSPILAKIRNKIERSKYYPQQARLQHLEGRPEVSFKIAPNGTIESVHLARSSGNALLDSAAIETVNRAAPFPFYGDEISLAIKYSLAD